MKNVGLKSCFKHTQSTRTALAINDVFKAYDQVNTHLLYDQLKSKGFDKMASLVQDYDKCNLSIGPATIKRSLGLPQGAKGAPMLFNFYLSNAIGNNVKGDFIYADNIILLDTNKKKLEEKIDAITKNCNKANLKFDNNWDYWAYSFSDLDKYETKCNFEHVYNLPNDIPIIDHPTTRILGYRLKTKNDRISMDKDNALKNITYHLPMLPPYKALTHFKQYIKPKFAFHFKNNPPKHIIQTIIRRLTCIRNLPNDYLDPNHVYDTGNANYWSKFWSFYCYKKNGNITLPKGVDKTKYRRFLILTTLVDRYYLSIYQIVKFICFGKANILPLQFLDYYSLKNNLKCLDQTWFMIARKYNQSKMRITLELAILNRTKQKKRNTAFTKPLPISAKMIKNDFSAFAVI